MKRGLTAGYTIDSIPNRLIVKVTHLFKLLTMTVVGIVVYS